MKSSIFHRTADQKRLFTKHLYQLIAALEYSERLGSEWQADNEKPRPNSDNRQAESGSTGER
jgi:hypothetical protein